MYVYVCVRELIYPDPEFVAVDDITVCPSTRSPPSFIWFVKRLPLQFDPTRPDPGLTKSETVSYPQRTLPDHPINFGDIYPTQKSRGHRRD